MRRSLIRSSRVSVRAMPMLDRDAQLVLTWQQHKHSKGIVPATAVELVKGLSWSRHRDLGVVRRGCKWNVHCVDKVWGYSESGD